MEWFLRGVKFVFGIRKIYQKQYEYGEYIEKIRGNRINLIFTFQQLSRKHFISYPKTSYYTLRWKRQSAYLALRSKSLLKEYLYF